MRGPFGRAAIVLILWRGPLSATRGAPGVIPAAAEEPAASRRRGCAATLALLSHSRSPLAAYHGFMAIAAALQAKLFTDYRGAAMPRGHFRSVAPP